EVRSAQSRRETVRIERRRADQREDVAVRGVDDDSRTAHIGERLLTRKLQAHVQRQNDVVAGHGPFRLESAEGARGAAVAIVSRRVEQYPALRVDDLLPVTDMPVQQPFVAAFDPALAD